ncbi:MAG: HAMP domain-containing protein [Gammaproteobacteria bacterium]|nr:HAMP domain-containing protein [Gammaproteobacteria bacterium]
MGDEPHGSASYPDVKEEQKCLIPPRSRWYRPGRGIICKQIMVPLMMLCVSLVGIIILQIVELSRHSEQSPGDWALLFVVVVMLGLMIKVILFIRMSLLNPLTEIRQWVSSVEDGDFDARMPLLPMGEFNDLAQDINHLARSIETLNADFSSQVAVQTENLARKSQALELLYEVVTSANTDHEVTDLLTRFMHRLGGVYEAQAVVVRVLENHQLTLVDSYGLSAGSTFLRPSVPIRFVRQNNIFGKGSVDVRNETINESLAELDHRDDKSNKVRQIISIPLQYRDSILGCYQIFVDSGLVVNNDNRTLLANIGQHLGAVLQQSRQDQDSGKLIMVEERTKLANELHDSLAQTLASLRFQVRVLDETLHQGDEQVTWEALEKLESQVEEANRELRVLIGQFRAPLQNQEVVVSVKKLVEKFRKDTGVSVFLQNEWSDDNLTTEMRTDVIRIIQEALANTRKHAQADNVRVLIRHQSHRYRIMVEDDGKGFDETRLVEMDSSGHPGEHIGHKIMAERAKNLGAELKFESEPEEGCLLSVEFVHVMQDSQNND